MPRKLTAKAFAADSPLRSIETAGEISVSEIADGSIHTAKLADGAVTADKMAPGAVSNTQGMVHAFVADGTTGQLNWIDNVSALQDADGNDLYDSVIVGTDDMVFTVDANGHLIMTIS